MASNNNQNEAPNTGSTIHISETFFDKYKKAIIYGVVAVIVIVAGAIIYNNYVAARERKSQHCTGQRTRIFRHGRIH